MEKPTTDPILTGLTQGKPGAYRDLYQIYGNSLYRYFAAMTGHRTDAEDLLHNLLAQLWRHREGLANVRDLRAWLFHAAHNLAANFLRDRSTERRHLQPATNLHLNRPDPNSREATIRFEREEWLRISLLGLPVEQREVILLHLNEGMTFREIADALTVNMNTITYRYQSGIGKLKEKFRGKEEPI